MIRSLIHWLFFTPGSRFFRFLPLWAATGLSGSKAGLGGVLFLRFPFFGHTVVLKQIPDDAEAIMSHLACSICAQAGVVAPRVEILSLNSGRGRALVRKVKALAPSPTKRIAGQIKSILEKSDKVLLMEFVRGGPLMPTDDAAACAERLRSTSMVEQMGRLMAVDIVINNWDRLPLDLDVWAPDPSAPFAAEHQGNPDNVHVRDDDGAIVAIDTDFKRFYPGPGAGGPELVDPGGLDSGENTGGRAHGDELYLDQVAMLFGDVAWAAKATKAAGKPTAAAASAGAAPAVAPLPKPSRAARALRNGLQPLRGAAAVASLSDELLRRYDAALAEGLNLLLKERILPRQHSAAVAALGGEAALSERVVKTTQRQVRRAERVLDAWEVAVSAAAIGFYDDLPWQKEGYKGGEQGAVDGPDDIGRAAANPKAKAKAKAKVVKEYD